MMFGFDAPVLVGAVRPFPDDPLKRTSCPTAVCLEHGHQGHPPTAVRAKHGLVLGTAGVRTVLLWDLGAPGPMWRGSSAQCSFPAPQVLRTTTLHITWDSLRIGPSDSLRLGPSNSLRIGPFRSLRIGPAARGIPCTAPHGAVSRGAFYSALPCRLLSLQQQAASYNQPASPCWQRAECSRYKLLDYSPVQAPAVRFSVAGIQPPTTPCRWVLTARAPLRTLLSVWAAAGPTA